MKFFQCPKLTLEFGIGFNPKELDKLLDYIESHPESTKVKEIQTFVDAPSCNLHAFAACINDLFHKLEMNNDHSGASFNHLAKLIYCILKEGGRDQFILNNNPRA